MPPLPSKGVCAHDHECDQGDEDCSGSFAVFKTINLERTRCLNEAAPNSCHNVFRAWDSRLDVIDTPLRSEPTDSDDEDGNELLLHIEFDASVKLKAFSVIGGLGDEFESRPRVVRLFVNRDDLDFATVKELEAVQSFDLLDNQAGTVEYPVKASKFSGVHSLDMHFPSISENERQVIYFVGFKGEHESRRRQAVDAVYEGVALPSDHPKVHGEGRTASSLGYS